MATADESARAHKWIPLEVTETANLKEYARKQGMTRTFSLLLSGLNQMADASFKPFQTLAYTFC
jgi:hypothetical protein